LSAFAGNSIAYHKIARQRDRTVSRFCADYLQGRLLAELANRAGGE
jgi:hypothetical protein